MYLASNKKFRALGDFSNQVSNTCATLFELFVHVFNIADYQLLNRS